MQFDFVHVSYIKDIQPGIFNQFVSTKTKDKKTVWCPALLP